MKFLHIYLFILYIAQSLATHCHEKCDETDNICMEKCHTDSNKCWKECSHDCREKHGFLSYDCLDFCDCGCNLPCQENCLKLYTQPFDCLATCGCIQEMMLHDPNIKGILHIYIYIYS